RRACRPLDLLHQLRHYTILSAGHYLNPLPCGVKMPSRKNTAEDPALRTLVTFITTHSLT
ncbi:MAG TPA: hypothetical protein O0X77_01690, partial [Methanocorpusculum sp.]|nr:hypothetical protein [Methanocorpusculum sp.]